jgi:LysR family transcriptional regulator for bpeEF and oprC
MQNMDKLKAISIFVEIADHGSMSAAARSLGVVNSVVTKNLNELESWLGKKLVFRSTRNLRLTQDGMNYLAECRAILQQVDQLETQARLDEQVVQGRVKVTAPFYLGQRIFSPLLADMHAKYPQIQLDLVLSDCFEDLVKEGFDIALRASQMPDSNFISRRIRPVSLKLVASPLYLEKYGAPTSPRVLEEHNCIIEGSSDGQRRWRFKSRGGKQQSTSVNGNIRVNYGGMVKALCVQGLGIAQLPDFIVEEELQEGILIELLPELAMDNFYIHILYHQRSTTNLATKSIIEYILESLSLTES